MKTPKNALEAIGNPIHQVFRENGITAEYLVKKLKKELNAEKTVFQKVKGSAEIPLTPTGKPKKGLKIVTTTGLIEKRFVDGETEKEFTDGETVIAINMTDWTTRQKARMDAHKLRGDYPSEKHEVSLIDTPILNAIIKMVEDAKGPEYAETFKEALIKNAAGDSK